MEEEMKCALCGKRARMLCESDQAKLCWHCDTIVHGANFLVAKHLRVLLCRHCQSPTPWKASGPSLTPTSSLCHRCLLIPSASNAHHHHHHRDDEHDDHSYDEEDESDDDSDVPEDEEEEEEGENQVVPWSSDSVAVVAAGSASASSDNDGDMSSNAASPASTFPLNRSPHRRSITHHSDEDYEDDIGCCSSERMANDESSSMMSMLRPLKKPRIITQRDADAAQCHNQRWGRTGI